MFLRLFEILPAFLAWSTLLLPFVLIHYAPVAVAIFLMLYVFMWFLRAIEFGYFLVYSYIQYKKVLSTRWEEKAKMLPKTDIRIEDVIHLIIIPTYKESGEVLEESIHTIASANYDQKKIIVCLATEERDAERGRKNAAFLQKKYAHVFRDFWWVEHPKNLPHEIAGKGANITYAGRQCAQNIRKANIPLHHVLVTTLDADNKIHNDLLWCLSIAYVQEPERHKRSFQPIPLFFNNIWQVPVLNRIVALSSGYWHMIESGRPDRLRNFSSHSQPLTALVEMDFWDVTTIVEDGRQYWRSYLHFFGDYEVIPVFLPIYQDAIMSSTLFRSLVGQFQQLRRWAWGASDIAYFADGIRKHWKKLPKGKTLLQFFRLVEGHYMWATAALFLSIATPSLRFLWEDFSESVLGNHIALILSTLFHIALFGICISIVLTFFVLPAPPKKSQRIGLLFQWILFPVVTICFGTFPALVAQTQLALGQKMKFNVTEKVVKKKRSCIHTTNIL